MMGRNQARYVSSSSPGSSTSQTLDDVIFGGVCQMAAPGAKSAVSDCILFLFVEKKFVIFNDFLLHQ